MPKTTVLDLLKPLRALWAPLADGRFGCAAPEDIARFERKTGRLMPADLKTYFVELNGTHEQYDENFFRFQALGDFRSIDDELRYWGGIPDYTGIVDTLPDYAACFVFADHSIQLITYAIRLHEATGGTNEVYAICGSAQAVVAQSFTEFLTLYLRDWREVTI